MVKSLYFRVNVGLTPSIHPVVQLVAAPPKFDNCIPQVSPPPLLLGGLHPAEHSTPVSVLTSLQTSRRERTVY